MNCFDYHGIVILQFGNISNSLIHIVLNFIEDVVEVLSVEGEGVGKDVDGLLACFDEGSGNFVDKVNFLDEHSGDGMPNNGKIFELHVVFHGVHCEVSTQHFEVPEIFMCVIVDDVTAFGQDLNRLL